MSDKFSIMPTSIRSEVFSSVATSIRTVVPKIHLAEPPPYLKPKPAPPTPKSKTLAYRGALPTKQGASESGGAESRGKCEALICIDTTSPNPWMCATAIPQLQGYLAHKKTPTPLGHPYGPRHSPTVGSKGGAVSYERGTPAESNP